MLNSRSLLVTNGYGRILDRTFTPEQLDWCTRYAGQTPEILSTGVNQDMRNPRQMLVQNGSGFWVFWNANATVQAQNKTVNIDALAPNTSTVVDAKLAKEVLKHAQATVKSYVAMGDVTSEDFAVAFTLHSKARQNAKTGMYERRQLPLSVLSIGSSVQPADLSQAYGILESATADQAAKNAAHALVTKAMHRISGTLEITYANTAPEAFWDDRD